MHSSLRQTRSCQPKPPQTSQTPKQYCRHTHPHVGLIPLSICALETGRKAMYVNTAPFGLRGNDGPNCLVYGPLEASLPSLQAMHIRGKTEVEDKGRGGVAPEGGCPPLTWVGHTNPRSSFQHICLVGAAVLIVRVSGRCVDDCTSMHHVVVHQCFTRQEWSCSPRVMAPCKGVMASP